MKTQLLTLTLFTLLISCSKKNDPTLTPLEQLPPKTHIGANTAGCLVNGEAFLPKGYTPSGVLTCFYTNQKYFSLSILEKINNNYKSIDIFHNNIELEVGIIYKLNTLDGRNAKTAEFVINEARPPSPDFYTTTPQVTGELVITHHDYNNATISGTFWFDAINSTGEKVEVREGRFDMEY